MSTSQNTVTIGCLDRWNQTINAMSGAGLAQEFASAFLRLHALFASYLAHETPEDRRRTASVWANSRAEHDYYWYIQEWPRNALSPDQDITTILAGGFHFHASDRTWTINT